MNLEQFNYVRALPEASATISAAQLTDQTPRTLVFGYTCDRETFHVYLDEAGELVKVVYDMDGILYTQTKGKSLPVADCKPNKRAYPEACDLDMSVLMHMCGCPLCFTAFNEQRTPGLWHGKRLENLLPAELREQLKFSVPVGIDEIGLVESGISEGILYSQDFGDAFIARVQEAVNAQLECFMRSVLVRGESREEAQRWLNNVPGSIAYRVMDASGLVEWKMPDEIATALVQKLATAVDAHRSS